MSTVTNGAKSTINGAGNANGENAKEEGGGMMNGTLNRFVAYGAPGVGSGGVENGGHGHEGVGNGGGERDDDSTIADPNEQLRMESRGASVGPSNGSPAVNGHRGSEDVEMDD